jgi:hypothetical protein
MQATLDRVDREMVDVVGSLGRGDGLPSFVYQRPSTWLEVKDHGRRRWVQLLLALREGNAYLRFMLWAGALFIVLVVVAMGLSFNLPGCETCVSMRNCSLTALLTPQPSLTPEGIALG